MTVGGPREFDSKKHGARMNSVPAELSRDGVVFRLGTRSETSEVSVMSLYQEEA